VKALPEADAELCTGCGNCTRCNYLALTLDARGVPRADPSRCIGCTICVQKCFAGALAMRARTAVELAALAEH
jgi:heterodisulfide reductase subunit A-like polyferredoxin